MAQWSNTCEISSTSRAIGLFLHLLNIFPCLFQWFEKTVIAERTITKISLKRRHANGYTKFVITFYPVLHSYAILILCPISYFLIAGYLLWGIFNFKPPIDWLLVIIVIVIYFLFMCICSCMSTSTIWVCSCLRRKNGQKNLRKSVKCWNRKRRYWSGNKPHTWMLYQNMKGGRRACEKHWVLRNNV